MENKETSNLKVKKNSKKIILITSIVLIVVIAIFSISMAYYQKVLSGNRKYVIKAMDVLFQLNETSNSISIGNTIPQTDDDGKNNGAYTFSLSNLASETIYQYTIYLENDTIPDGYTRVSDEFIKYYLTNDSLTTQMDPALVSTLSSDDNGRILETGTIAGGFTYNYTLRFWVDYDATQDDVSGKAFSTRLNVIVEEVMPFVASFGEDTSNANAPILTSGMIPVVYDETGKKWVKADDTIQENYYNYDQQIWANAVTVTEETRDYYNSMKNGFEVSMDDINTMWVWIPKYEYQYTDLSTSYAGGTKAQPGEIKINFISSDTLTPSDSTKYQIPEGFKFGEENIPGFWMAKFETSILESCEAKDYSVDADCDLTSYTPQVKPNIKSWRGARVSTFFNTIRNMQNSNNANIYGFDVEGTGTMDVHMLKNTEWGIVAMLSQTKYGKYGNSSYEGTNKEVYQNKSDDFITGMSNGTPGQNQANTQVTYDIPDNGYGASTTGTIYGVYDMSGGSWETVMGNYNNVSGNTSYNSGFCGTKGPEAGVCRDMPNQKYYDLYTSNTASTAYKIGDATYETSAWYNDLFYFISSSFPWFIRGGFNNSIGTGAGVFETNYNTGHSTDEISCRIVIKP